MMVLITAAVAMIVLASAMTWPRNLSGSSDGREIARRPDWSDEQYRRAVEEYRKDQEAGPRRRVQVALWALFALLAVWMAVQLGT
jgi:hypothetical protein